MKQMIFLSMILSCLSRFINNEIFAAESTGFSISSRLAGAEDADIKYFPYQASLRINGRYFCSACSISEDDILTAAHCFTENENLVYPYLDITVHTGTSSSQVIGTAHRVLKVTLHPQLTADWDTSFVHDIAHIKLADKIKISRNQKWIRLAKQNVVSNRMGIVTGWGATDPTYGGVSERLQQLEMRILNYIDCQNYVPTQLYPEQLCAFTQEDRGCTKGDSGAPLVMDNELIGIHSWVRSGFCTRGEAEIFTNVFAESDFIQQAMNGKLETHPPIKRPAADPHVDIPAWPTKIKGKKRSLFNIKIGFGKMSCTAGRK